MNRPSFALAILALAILACAAPSPTLPTQLPTQIPTALAIPARTATPLPTHESALAMVTAARSLHVRIQPMTDPAKPTRVIGYLYFEDQVDLTGSCLDGWAQIIWQGATAWVNASFLSDNKCQTSEEE